MNTTSSSSSQKKKIAATASILLMVATLTVQNLDLLRTTTKTTTTNHSRRQLKQEVSYVLEDVIPLEEICLEQTPPTGATLHTQDIEALEHYNTFFTRTTDIINRGDDMPELVTKENVKYAFWNKRDNYQTSVWAVKNPEDCINVPGGGFKPPTPEDVKRKRKQALKGDWAAFGGMWYQSYGHYGHDHLPTIAYLRQSLPETTKFLLIDHPIARKTLQEIDPTFYRRIKWIQQDTIYHILGKLTVAVRRDYHIPVGCCRQFDPLRNWLTEALPEDPNLKTVVFYSRRGVSRSRLLDEENEKQVIHHIQMKMKQYQVDARLVIFNGKDPKTGQTITVGDQFRLFRSAKTVIGPEGSGIGGNFVYTKPNPQSCDERVQLLEFMGGQDTPDVHDGTKMVTHYQSIRKWPIDYHNIYFTPESNHWTTYVNLDDLDCALDAMWGGIQCEKAVIDPNKPQTTLLMA